MEKGFKKGMQQGIQQGLKQGIQSGERKLLCMQLKQKFGSIPPNALEIINSADCTSLECIGQALLKATSIDEVFFQHHALTDL